jgi:hypothetical protein
MQPMSRPEKKKKHPCNYLFLIQTEKEGAKYVANLIVVQLYSRDALPT